MLLAFSKQTGTSDAYIGAGNLMIEGFCRQVTDKFARQSYTNTLSGNNFNRTLQTNGYILNANHQAADVFTCA